MQHLLKLMNAENIQIEKEGKARRSICRIPGKLL
jgi:hypothetical protein